MRSFNLSKTAPLSPPSSVDDSGGQPSDVVQWPFPQKLIRPSDQWSLSSQAIPTYADMTTELGDALW